MGWHWLQTWNAPKRPTHPPTQAFTEDELLGQVGVTHNVGWFADLISGTTHSYWNHTVGYIGNGKIISAEPGGAVIRDVSEYDIIVWTHLPMTKTQAQKSAAYGASRVGAPYGYMQIPFIFIALITGIHTPRWIERELMRSDRVICSQLCDEMLRHAGVHVFRDDRPSDAVLPRSFARVDERFGWMPKGSPR